VDIQDFCRIFVDFCGHAEFLKKSCGNAGHSGHTHNSCELLCTHAYPLCTASPASHYFYKVSIMSKALKQRKALAQLNAIQEMLEKQDDADYVEDDGNDNEAEEEEEEEEGEDDDAEEEEEEEDDDASEEDDEAEEAGSDFDEEQEKADAITSKMNKAEAEATKKKKRATTGAINQAIDKEVAEVVKAGKKRSSTVKLAEKPATAPAPASKKRSARSSQPETSKQKQPAKKKQKQEASTEADAEAESEETPVKRDGLNFAKRRNITKEIAEYWKKRLAFNKNLNRPPHWTLPDDIDPLLDSMNRDLEALQYKMKAVHDAFQRHLLDPNPGAPPGQAPFIPLTP
jgi:hypothetical protein